jgi:phosphopantothenoylcysteine synthetase/decarboxylase
MFDEIDYEDVRHISLAQGADLALIAPATANIIGKLSWGIADDMLSTTLMAIPANRVIIAPAMNTAMYENPIVQANIERLESFGYSFIEPRVARLACGDLGKGALAEVEVIVQRAYEFLGVENT